TQNGEVPSLLMRQGNFSELLTTNIWYGSAKIIYNPTTCPSVGAATCVPFANNTIPVSMISKNGQAILNAYPAPNSLISGNQNWIAPASEPENQRKETINPDILPTSVDRIQFRRTALAYYELDPFDQNLGITPKSFNRPNQAGSVAWI